MWKNLAVHLAAIAVSAFVAWVLVNAFDAWYVDKEARREAKRQRQEGRYE